MQRYSRLPCLNDDDRLLQAMVADILDSRLSAIDSTASRWLPAEFEQESSKMAAHVRHAKKYWRRIGHARRHVADRRSTVMVTAVDYGDDYAGKTRLQKIREESDEEEEREGGEREGEANIDIECYRSDNEEEKSDEEEDFTLHIRIDSDDDEQTDIKFDELDKTISDMKSMTSRFNKVAHHKPGSRHRAS